MKELARYLLENLFFDFQGDVNLERMRELLRADDSREARALLSKLIEDKGIDELLGTVADCLREYIRTGVSEDIIKDQLSLYGES